jgi:hypothetical protein
LELVVALEWKDANEFVTKCVEIGKSRIGVYIAFATTHKTHVTITVQFTEI